MPIVHIFAALCLRNLKRCILFYVSMQFLTICFRFFLQNFFPVLPFHQLEQLISNQRRGGAMLRSLIMSQSQSPATLIWQGEGGMPQININRNRPLGFQKFFGGNPSACQSPCCFLKPVCLSPTISQQNLVLAGGKCQSIKVEGDYI